MTKVLLTAAVYLGALTIVTAVAFVAVMILAGPHAGLLPAWLEPIVLALGWLVVIVVPIVIARRAWRRFGKTEPPTNA